MSILVIAEHDNKELKTSTLSTLAAAKKLGDNIDLLVAGKNVGDLAQMCTSIGVVKKVLCTDDDAFEHQIAETLADTVVAVSNDYTHILAPASTFGKNVMPRISALLDVQQISEIIEIVDVDTFVRPIYAGNAIATVQSSDAIKAITVRPTAFDAVETSGGSASVENVAANTEKGTLTTFVGQELSVSERPELTSANVVVSGGRGLGAAENFAIIEKLADKLGAAVGASRAAVDAGYVPNDYQVGQTGKVVAPQLYVAIGISGAIQHLAGMKDSKVIVAINKDEDAPIFQVADYGLVADLFDVVPELEGKL